MDAGTFLPGIKGPPDAAIIHPGEGGISVGSLSGAKRIDLVFMLDDSVSMSDKHDVLKAAIPDLLNRFVNPVCIDRFGHTSQPVTADAPCPDEQNRQFAPVRDMHIGIVTSSLGSADVPNPYCAPTLGDRNDSAHFVGSLPRGASIPTSAQGFLVWDPDQKANPPGQKDVSVLVDSFRGLVDAVGQKGCGFESQLESWYRLLVDPEPRLSTKLLPCAGADSGLNCPGPDGIDQTVLDARTAFLRPDSLLVVVMLTDENDCSMTDLGSATINFGTSNVMPQGSSVCATNPDDPCCYPCTSAPPAGCPNPDPVCSVSKFATTDNEPNIRCFNGKQRFGFDPLRPVQRYIDALTKPTVPNRAGDAVPNPLFAGGQRTPGEVFLVGILGVPWQDVATDATLGSPTDLKLKSVRELRDNGGWGLILGDPATHTPPRDTLLLEARDPRMGSDPVTGAALAPPTAGFLANPINGHERVQVQKDDLQYSCIFPLPMARECITPQENACECAMPSDGTMNPICQAPDGTYTTTQRFAKAYPPVRELEVIQGVGDSGVVASICPKNATDPTSESYGYRPVIGTLVQDVAPKLIR
jgi:hypothetical protein